MQKNKSQMVAQTTEVRAPRSSFNYDHTHKTTLSCDKLIPFYVEEIIPGDTFNVNVDLFMRMNTPLVPIMDDIKAETFFFFVPNRLTWDNFTKFMGEQENPDDSINYIIPQMQQPELGGIATGHAPGTIGNYFGLPNMGSVGTGSYYNTYTVNALPFRAVHRIWNEWFRSQDLQDSSQFANTDDGPDIYDGTETVAGISNYAGTCLPRNKMHDYFTSCLPFPQKGPDVPILNQNEHPVLSRATTGNAISVASGADDQYYRLETSGSSIVMGNTSSTQDNSLITETNGTINQLREAFQLQYTFELLARGGTRYIELINAMFQVKSSDSRLQRSEYLGGGSAYVNMTPVTQTVRDATTPLGDIGAQGTLSGGRHGFTKSFEEHGYVIGLLNVTGALSYSTGLDKKWTRQTRFDLFTPPLAKLGEEAVLSRELCVSESTDVKYDDVFGYQERYADYKYKQNMVTATMASQAPDSLDVWHLAQELNVPPVLDSDFLIQSTPLDRSIAVPDGGTVFGNTQFVVDAFFKIKAARPIPIDANPVSLGRF